MLRAALNSITQQEKKEQNLHGDMLDPQDDVAYQNTTLVEEVNYSEVDIEEGIKNGNFFLIPSDEIELIGMSLIKAVMDRSIVVHHSLV